MSHFYGTIQGGRGQATRGGSTGDGIATDNAANLPAPDDGETIN